MDVITTEEPAKVRGNLSIMAVLTALARRWRLLALCTGCWLGLGCALAVFLPAEYTATTVLLPPQDHSAAAGLMSQLGNLGSVASAAGADVGMRSLADLYTALLQTEPVEQAMVRRFDLMQVYHAKTSTDARVALAKHTVIANDSKDGLIRITITSKDRNRAAAMANGYVAVFQAYSQDKAISEAAQRRAFFSDQLRTAKAQLDDAEVALKETEQSKGLVQLGGQSMALVEAAASLRAQIAAKEVEVASMRAYAGDKNIDPMTARQQLAGWQAQLAHLQDAQGGGSGSPMLSSSQMPAVELAYAQRARDVKYDEAVFEFLARQVETAKLDEAREGDRLQIMAAAVVPEKRSGPPRLLFCVGSAITGFFLASVFVLFAEGYRQLRRSSQHRAEIDEFFRQFQNRRTA